MSIVIVTGVIVAALASMVAGVWVAGVLAKELSRMGRKAGQPEDPRAGDEDRAKA